MMSNLPERWLTNATVVLANGCVRRLLLEVLIEWVQFSAKSRHICVEGHQAEGVGSKSFSAVELDSGGPTAELPELGTSLTTRSIGMMSMVVS